MKKPLLVLIAGFGAGACIFYRMLRDLSQYFEIMLVDLLGMGSSGRPKYNAKTAEEGEEFFVEALKTTLSKLIASDREYYLAGHSFGGFIAAKYAIKYPSA